MRNRMEKNTVDLSGLLGTTVEMDGSDLHISPGTPPRVRIHGQVVCLSQPSLTADQTKRLAYSVMTDKQKFRFEEDLELDFSFGLKGTGRFRANVFTQRGAVAAVFRAIPLEILPLEKLALPPIIGTLTQRRSGLVLVTGPTGTGKSTTLAALIDKINRELKGHILTVEDPIEFIHQHRNCIVNQRELTRDTTSFGKALRNVLREDPDVVLVGEMRDLETIEQTLRIAETGHLTFSTLHTNSADSTINRIIDVFPSHQQNQIRGQLAMVLEGIVSQRLVRRADGTGRIAATEILIPTPAVRNLIRENKVHQIYSAMQTGQEKHGMQTMNQSLASLYIDKKITYEDCLDQSTNAEELQQILKRSGQVRPTARVSVGA